MLSEKEIRKAVEAFILASASETASGRVRKDAELDVLIAKRGGDEAAVTAAIAVEGSELQRWYADYLAMKEAAQSLCKAVGIDPARLKTAL